MTLENLSKQIIEEKKKRKKFLAKDLYEIIQEFIKEQIKKTPVSKGNRKLYYISAEFLLGKMLTSNAVNLGILDELKLLVEKEGFTWKQIQDEENEPSLGNGGLGRLAACFLDSIAGLKLPGDGIGLYYHFGLFEQKFKKYKQIEEPNRWIDRTTWFTRKDVNFKVPYKDGYLYPVLYDMEIIGEKQTHNVLHLFDLKSVDEGLVKEGIEFDKEAVDKNLTLFLYPDDSDKAGRKLRIYQQYFMVSCAAQMILQEASDKGWKLDELDQHVIVQINDTHPTMVILEFIRLLRERGFLLAKAIDIA